MKLSVNHQGCKIPCQLQHTPLFLFRWESLLAWQSRRPACLLVEGHGLCSGVGGLIQCVFLSWPDQSTSSALVCSVPSRIEGDNFPFVSVQDFSASCSLHLCPTPLAHSQFISESEFSSPRWLSCGPPAFITCTSQTIFLWLWVSTGEGANLISLSLCVEYLVYKLSKYLRRHEDNVSVIYPEGRTLLYNPQPDT